MNQLFPVRSALLLLIAGLLCTARLAAEGETEQIPAPEPRYTFAIVYPIVHPFFEPVTEHALRYAGSKNIRIIARAPEGRDVDEQIAIMESLIEQRVDGIAVVATDPVALAPYVDKALERGIPTIAFESDIPESSRLAFIGTDNYRAGQHLAEVLARQIQYRGKLIICTGLSTQMSLNQRIRGIQDTLSTKYRGVKIVDIRSGEGNPELTLDIIESQIEEHPDFDAFTSIDATGGPIAVAIWKAKGWTGEDRKIITFDDMPGNLAGLRDGIVDTIISQKQWTWGPLIVDSLEAIIAGEPVPDYLDTGTVEIRRSNIDTYR